MRSGPIRAKVSSSASTESCGTCSDSTCGPKPRRLAAIPPIAVP